MRWQHTAGRCPVGEAAYEALRSLVPGRQRPPWDSASMAEKANQPKGWGAKERVLVWPTSGVGQDKTAALP